MIEVEAPDGTIVEFPDGTPREVMRDAMQRRFGGGGGGSAPGAPPSATPAPAPAAPAAPADDSFMGSLLSALGYADRTGANFVRGARQGLANIVGLPVDLVNASPVLVGAEPFSEEPAFGSKSIDRALSGYGAIPEPPADDIVQRGARRVGEEVGAAAVPTAAALGTAARVGVEGARQLPSLARMFVEPAAVNPARFVGKETAAAVAAGLGATGGRELARASGYGETGQNVGDLAGALSGLGLYGIGVPLATKSFEVFQALRGAPNYTDDVVRQAAADTIIEAAGIQPRVAGEAVDTTGLVDTIMNGRRVADTIPGFQESLADRTANPGIAALEYSRQSGPNSGEFTNRRAENTRAVDNAMTAVEPQGSPGALREELALERDRRLTDAEIQALNARDEAARAVAPLQPTTTPAARGNAVRSELEAQREAARQRTADAYDNADVAGNPVDPTDLRAAIEGVTERLTEVERGLVPQGVLDRVARLGVPDEAGPVPTGVLGPDGQPIARPPAPPEPVTLKEATDLSSELKRLQRAALADPRAERGGRNAARVLGQYIDAVEGYIGRNLTDEQRQAVDAARGARFEEAEAFGRQGDPVASALQRYEGGQPRMSDERVAGSFVNPQAMDRLFAQADTPQVRTAIREEVLSRGDTTSADRIRNFMGDYGEQINRFPGLRDELENAARAREAEAAAATNQQSIIRELGDGRTIPGRSTVGQYLRFGDENAERAMQSVLGAKEPGRAADELLSFVNDEPQAVEGARKVFWDIMQKKSRSAGETTKTVDGTQPWMPAALKRFLDDPRNNAVAERLYRDNPEHLDRIRQIADALQGVDIRARAKAPGTSGTAQGVNPVLTPETLQSRIYAYQRGAVSGNFLITSIAAVTARRAVRKAQSEGIQRLLDDALLNPDTAALLLKENNPANRAALARKAKGWMGNEASTLIDILDQQPDDELKGTINGR